MPGKQIEIILSRQLADCLSLAIFLTDAEGTLLFFNEPAEKILGKRFEETGRICIEEWSTIFKPVDEAGRPIPPEDLPLSKTLAHHQPSHGTFWIESLQGERHKISVTAVPVIGRASRFQGAMAIFWKNVEP